jgi:DNA-binding response OmpR family regulator
MPLTQAPAEKRVERGAWRVLIVEDEPKVAAALHDGLVGEGYQAVIEGTGEGAFFRSAVDPCDLIVLDLGLPGRDGLEVLRALRASRVTTPVLILTARDAPEDRVLGLDEGADDYLVKPFAFAELLARIRALLRRGQRAEPLQIAVDDLEIDLAARRATRGGERLDLTPREFSVLHLLMKHEGEVVSRDMLAGEVWPETSRSSTLNNVIDVHIARLRRKVDAERPRRLIHTLRGVGFTLSREAP